MIRVSECVSPGHPDKVADFISEYILDRYIEQDPATRYAVEVQIKDKYVTLGGEVSSRASFDKNDLARFVQEAVNKIGYTREYQDQWGRDNTICGDELQVTSHISIQSPDIAKGVDNDGWGDQGIFFGMAKYDPAGTDYGMMPTDFAIARKLNHALFRSGIGGLDIKTQVVMDEDEIKRVICAIPLLAPSDKAAVEDFVRARLLPGNYALTINGTGEYVRHSSIADCGTTGRKLAVDFYGSGCRIGGGSPWTKDGTKADLALNLYARKLAKKAAKEFKTTCYTSLACCIGRTDVDFCITNADGNVIDQGVFNLPKSRVIGELGLDKPIFEDLCNYGLFGEYKQNKAWEE